MPAIETTHLFTPLKLRSLELRNRIVVSPMCQYSSPGGFATDWHLVHLGSRAIGGAAVVFTEATAITAEGRISPDDLGLWSDDHIPPLARITRFIREHGALAGIQLAHAGRKAATAAPWIGTPGTPGGKPLPESERWPIIAPSPIAYASDHQTPHALSLAEIRGVIDAFTAAARRARQAGFQILEIHAAHGYLIHQFLSPISNHRTDEYGGSFDNRCRLLCEVIEAVRAIWDDALPLWVRISASDWTEGGWTIDDSVALARRVKPLGVDLIDCSSGGNVATAQVPVGPGYQTPFAERIRRDTSILTAAVGMITSPEQADHIIRTGQADLVVLARELLRHPYWPLTAAGRLSHPAPWPNQYLRAK